jgi:glycosyltransferase involved in cell wall biosynthesis
MNILFLDQFSDLGGAQRCLIDLLRAVHDRGWQIDVAAPGTGPLKERIEVLGSYHQIRSGPYRSGRKTTRDLFHFANELPILAREISNIAKECGANVVYVNGPRVLPAAAMAVGKRVPLIFHCHSHLRHRYAAVLAGISLASTHATVIASCNFVAEPLRLYLDSNQVTVVYNGVEGYQAHTSTEPRSMRRIGMIGRIAYEKGQLEFVQAARMFPANCSFVICGAPLFSNPAAVEYSERVRKAAIGLPVEFLGWRDDVHSVLAGLDLLVAPSAPGESTTRVILEAFAAGVPVVATRSGGIPEIVSDGETGYLLRAGDPETIAAKIREVVEDENALARIACNALRVWGERYTLAQYQSRILNILEKVGASART